MSTKATFLYFSLSSTLFNAVGLYFKFTCRQREREREIIMWSGSKNVAFSLTKMMITLWVKKNASKKTRIESKTRRPTIPLPALFFSQGGPPPIRFPLHPLTNKHNPSLFLSLSLSLDLSLSLSHTSYSYSKQTPQPSPSSSPFPPHKAFSDICSYKWYIHICIYIYIYIYIYLSLGSSSTHLKEESSNEEAGSDDKR
jgi:hypothetical protein